MLRKDEQKQGKDAMPKLKKTDGVMRNMGNFNLLFFIFSSYCLVTSNWLLAPSS
jgi:hypothetical protein